MTDLELILEDVFPVGEFAVHAEGLLLFGVQSLWTVSIGWLWPHSRFARLGTSVLSRHTFMSTLFFWKGFMAAVGGQGPEQSSSQPFGRMIDISKLSGCRIRV